ncbi:hypothetical protein [Corynebacterium freiburgense]|uniref:hypothetical protein n=1 Tax=Corynebacterium freiburgense TaxID=556548 RepID=UPI000478CFC9|nr:hypothetical protein [Corynebacterium freiburgense]
MGELHYCRPIDPVTITQFEPFAPPTIAEAYKEHGAGYINDGLVRFLDPTYAIDTLRLAAHINTLGYPLYKQAFERFQTTPDTGTCYAHVPLLTIGGAEGVHTVDNFDCICVAYKVDKVSLRLSGVADDTRWN